MVCVAAVAGCSGGGAPSSTPVAAASTPAERLTPESAARAFRSFVGNEDVSRSAGDERLALSWTLDGQSMLTAAAFRKAAFQDEPVPRYAYAKPKLYVPRIDTHPQWFLVVTERTELPPGEAPPPTSGAAAVAPTPKAAPEGATASPAPPASPSTPSTSTPSTSRTADRDAPDRTPDEAARTSTEQTSTQKATGKSTRESADKAGTSSGASAGGSDAKTRTALMVFVRTEPGFRWRLGLSTLLEKGAKLPHITVDAEGYAKPLATFDDGLVIQPRFVGAIQATLAEEGPGSLAADSMAEGKHTSDHYEKIQDKKKQMKEDGFAYDSIFTATQFPVYALRTNDGGGLVLYSMSRDTVVFRKSKKVSRIPIPRPAVHLLESLIMRNEMDVVEMHQYAATVPPKAKEEGKPAGKATIIGFDGAPVKATGT